MGLKKTDTFQKGNGMNGEQRKRCVRPRWFFLPSCLHAIDLCHSAPASGKVPAGKWAGNEKLVCFNFYLRKFIIWQSRKEIYEEL